MLNRSASTPRLDWIERTAIGALPDAECRKLLDAGYQLTEIVKRGEATVFRWSKPARPRPGDVENRVMGRGERRTT
jgi:hypothetical protein